MLSGESQHLREQLLEAEQANTDLRVTAHLARAEAAAARRKYRIQYRKLMRAHKARRKAMQHEIAACSRENAKNLREIAEARTERSTLANASRRERRAWQALAVTLTHSYDSDEMQLRNMSHDEAELKARMEAEEAAGKNLSAGLVREEQAREREISELRQKNEAQSLILKGLEQRAIEAAGNASDLLRLHFKDLSENQALYGQLNATKAELVSARSDLRIARKVHNASLRRFGELATTQGQASAEAERLKGALGAARAALTKEMSAEAEERKEVQVLAAKVNASARGGRMLEAQGDEAKKLLVKDKDLIGRCRTHARRVRERLEAKYQRDLEELRSNLTTEKDRERLEAVEIVRGNLSAVNAALALQNRALSNETAALQQEVGQQKVALSKYENLSASYEVLKKERVAMEASLTSANKALSDEFKVEYAAMKNENAGLAEQAESLKEQFSKKNEVLRRENRALAEQSSALARQREDLEATNRGLQQQNQALAGVVAQLRSQLEATQSVPAPQRAALPQSAPQSPETLSAMGQDVQMLPPSSLPTGVQQPAAPAEVAPTASPAATIAMNKLYADMSSLDSLEEAIHPR